MTTPNYPSMRYAPVFYPALSGLYTLPTQNALNPYLPQTIHSVPHQLPCQYILAPQAYPSFSQNYPMNVTFSPGMTQVPQLQQQAATQVVQRSAEIKN